MDAEDGRDVEELIAARRTASPRHTPGRDPVGARQTRRLVATTVAILAVVTVVLVAVLVVA